METAEKYLGRHRIPSARATWWEYDKMADYFVTINLRGRQHYFGEITDGQMHLTPAGAIADVLWRQIPLHRPDWKLGAYVIMPDHMHGVLTKMTPPDGGDAPKDDRPKQITSNSLSSVVGSYKSAVTKNVRHLGYDFGWQSRFYDVIIRDERHYMATTNYINDNVRRWWMDRGDGMSFQ